MASSTPRGYSLRGRVLALVLTAVAAGWLLVIGVSYVDTHRRLDELLDAHLAASAALLRAEVHEQLEDIEDLEIDHPQAPALYAQPVAFQVWEGGRRLALRSDTAPLQRFSPVDTGLSDATIDGVPWRVYGIWDERREFLIQVAEDHSERERIAAGVALGSLAPLLLGLPLLGGLVVWMVARACRPLGELAHEVSGRDARSLEPVRVAKVPREVRPLVERLNELLERVRRSLESERHFTADAAHEMRNPLAAVRAQAEVARDAADEAQRRHALQKVIEAADRLSRLVEQLLLLARIEHAPAEQRLERCELDELVRAVIADLAPAALAQDVELELEAPEAATVSGEPALLESLVRNLVDNAIRHGGSGRTVRVAVHREGHAVTLAVADEGEGLSDAELAHLGQRFFRGAAARGIGSGLGLSIVRQIAERHGATLRFAHGPQGRGLLVTVAFRGASSRDR